MSFEDKLSFDESLLDSPTDFTKPSVLDAAASAAAAAATASASTSSYFGESSIWQRTLERCIPAIVVIRVNSVRAFDGTGASYSYATGFVVDREKGLIMTNRHVVTPGPVTSDAIFVNKEEVDLRPIYRDPVHDFGFYAFDPSSIKFLKLEEITLAPEEAKVGTEIRVVGNDAGEKLSILPGILARLDREAPNYGSHDYNDFNTFYYAAASSTSGGSSGSPVLNINGKAIAINAGGAKKAASSFYLPLDRAVRALELIQRGVDVPRGTLQTIFRHCAFDEVRRLGLKSETELQTRTEFPSETGMLVVDQVVPCGPADNKVQPGDVLIRVAGKRCTTFIPLEDYLDEHVGKELEIEVERGGRIETFTLTIQDLHSITPACYLELSGAILHPLSYQQARNNSLPVGGVYMAQAGHMLVKAGITHQCIITGIGSVQTNSIEEFEKEFAKLPDNTRTSLKYYFLRDRHRIRTTVITVDRQWFPMQMCYRNDVDGYWHAVPSPEAPPPVPLLPPTTAPRPLSANRGANLDKVIRSLVLVSYDIPYMVDGISASSYTGVGVIFDTKRGLILVDKNTVPIPLGDVVITFFASLEIPGKVVMVHPIHNISVISYDPQQLGKAPVEEVTLSDKDLNIGDSAEFVGLTHSCTVVSQPSLVTKIDRLILREAQPPQYRAGSVEVIHFDRVTKSVGGVFVEKDSSRVQAFWCSFSYQDDGERKELFRGLPADIFADIVQDLKAEREPVIRSIGAQLLPFTLSKARAGLGLSEEWISKLEELHPDKRQVLTIKRMIAGTDAAEKLRNGDVLLTIDDNIIATFRDVEKLTKNEKVTVTVLRDGVEMTLDIQTAVLPNFGTDRVVMWSGMMVQEPHYAVQALGYLPEEGGGCYCARWCYGSPAHKFGLRATIWIIEVNGIPTPTLDAFLDVVSKLGDGEFIRLKTKDLNTKVKVFTLKTDYHYFSTEELRRSKDAWEFRSVTV